MIPARLPVLITGAPGIGKSDIVAQAAKQLDHELILPHPAVKEPTEVSGFPWPDHENDRARFLPFGDLATAIEAQLRAFTTRNTPSGPPPASA